MLGTVSHDVRVKRAVWRCWQFGMKEAELVLGNWANHHARHLDPNGMDHLEAVLQESTTDVVNWINGSQSPPDRIGRNPVLIDIIKFGRNGIPTALRKPPQ